MKLLKEKQQELISSLNQIWQNQKTCEICNSINWNVSDTVFELREFHEGAIGGGAIQPVITLTCLNCGNT